MIRMGLADKHPVVRYGLKRALGSTGTFTIVAEAATPPELWDLLQCAHIDVLICEMAIFGGKSCEELEEILKRRPHLVIVVFTMYAEASCVVESIRRGAKAYLSKEASVEELACAIRDAMSGKRYIESRLREQTSDDGLKATSPAGRALSPRETEVVRLIAGGKRNAEIAAALALSAKTISTYRARILEKMNLKTNGEIIRQVLQRGLASSH